MERSEAKRSSNSVRYREVQVSVMNGTNGELHCIDLTVLLAAAKVYVRIRVPQISESEGGGSLMRAPSRQCTAAAQPECSRKSLIDNWICLGLREPHATGRESRASECFELKFN
jgi:hypothetical protein